MLIITNENFKTEVQNSNVPVLIDFWAAWCGPCRMLTPIIDEIAMESNGTYKVGKINVDEQPELAAKFSIMNIPTVIVVKDGNVVKKAVGVRPKEELIQMLKESKNA